MCDPVVGASLAVLSGGLSIGGSILGQQEAENQTRQYNAQRDRDYRDQQEQAAIARQYEQMKYMQQESVMQQNRFFADNAYADDIAQLNNRFMQDQEATAQAKQKANIENIQAKGTVAATGRMGNSIDALVRDYDRQQLQFDYVTDRNTAFAKEQLQETKRGSAATRGSRIASQQPYIKQLISDPTAPIKQQMPSRAGMYLDIGGSVLKTASSVRTELKQSSANKNKDYTINYPTPR
jgi:hypothetical protein